MDERTRAEVFAVFTAYATAFRANDIQALDKLIQYPLAYIGNGQTTLVESYPIKPSELIATKQWHDAKDIAYEVIFASADKAHLILRHGTRVRADGSPIETVSLCSDPHTISMEVLRTIRHHDRCLSDSED